jgi:broad specificity phosphatase PhoE
MELFIVRHAQSVNNALTDQRDRVIDPPLTEIGLRQAELVARHLAAGTDHEGVPIEGQGTDAVAGTGMGMPAGTGMGMPAGMGIEKLYCSAMLRALQTAAPIGRALNLRPQVWVDVHEEGGMWLDEGEGRGIRGGTGLTRAEIARQFPDCVLSDEVTDNGWWRYGQEERAPFLARAARVAARLRADAARDVTVAIVTHGGFGAYLLRELVGAPHTANVFFHHDNTGITRVRFRVDGRVSIRYQNRVDHLPPDFVT